jgi:aspartate aminotransferase-like enzyme
MAGHDVLTMIPGPTPVARPILDALGRPTVSHQFPAFVDAFRQALADLPRIVRADGARPFLVSGAGTLGMEMALVNLLGPDDTLLVVSHGYFGDRWAELASAFGIRHEVVRAEWGTAVGVDELGAHVERVRPAAVTITHVDTSTGTTAPVADYARVLAGRDTLLVLDGVAATGGMDERFDDWGIDVLVTGAQKALGAPPGLAILVVSERALARRRARERVPAYYADLLRWVPIMDDPARYFSTPAVNEIFAVSTALRMVLDEGLSARFSRHARLARRLRDGLAPHGFVPVPRAEHLADTLSVLRLPDGVDDVSFRRGVAERGVVIAGALGPLAGRAVRVGHMGNIGDTEIDRTLDAMLAG